MILAAHGGAAELYLDLLKRCLTNWIYGASEPKPFDPATRERGADIPPYAHTMIGLHRLNNLQACLEQLLQDDVPGDVIEAGVCRGGAVIFMRAVLKVYGVTDRVVWAADSFEGIPAPDARYPADAGSVLHTWKDLAVPQQAVEANFAAYGLLDGQVRFLPGRFCDSLPTAPVEHLALVRLDGDLYESTIDALMHLYPRLSIGGYVIVDDYGCLPGCRQAVEDYRSAHGIDEPLLQIDWSGVYWRKGRSLNP